MSSPPNPGPHLSPDADSEATPPQGFVAPGFPQGPVRPRHAGPPVGGGIPGPPQQFADEQPRTEGWWPTEPAAEATTSGGAAQKAQGGVPWWLVGVAGLALLTVVGVLGWITPGYFANKVLDQVAVQNGVRTVLQNDYRLTNVAEVLCPANQKVLPGKDFTCTARINNAPARVRVVVQDRAGRYQVGRPA